MILETPSELQRLDSIAADSWYARGINAATVRYETEVFRRHWHGPRCLELGAAEGVMTEDLAREFGGGLAIVEGSKAFCADLSTRFPEATVTCSLFETFEPAVQFDTILMGQVLEHVEGPVALLRRAAGWLAPGGVICGAAPNAMSIHRQAAVLMGLLSDEHEMNENDVHHGHRRVYDPDSLRRDLEAAGLEVEAFGGFWLKPVSNAQVEAAWDAAMVEAFMKLGELHPKVAAMLYFVAGQAPGPG